MIINILIYSKFSQACRKFIELCQSSNSSNSFLEEGNLLCLDNKKVRERILYSEKLNIREVPCIVRVNQLTGFTELFEGEKSFLLLQNHIQLNQISQQNQSYNHSPLSQQSIQQPQPLQQLQPLPLQQQSQSQSLPLQQQSRTNVSNVSNVSNIIQEEIPEINTSQLRPPSKPKQDSIKTMQKNINNISNLEDLPELDSINNEDKEDENKENAVNTYMHVPKNVKFDIDSENSQRVAPERTIKAGSSGGSTISKALQMQKEREQESSVGVGGFRS